MRSILACLTLLAAPQDAPGPAPEIPELRPLEHYVGDWLASSNLKGDPEAADGAKTTGTARGEWILGGRFLRQTWKLDDAGELGPLSGMTLMTYDPARKVYRSWAFSSTGSALESEGRWAPGTRTMTWTGRDPTSDNTTTTTAAFSPDGVENWRIVQKARDGRIVGEIVGQNRRTK
jgi:hypothetical protein